MLRRDEASIHATDRAWSGVEPNGCKLKAVLLYGRNKRKGKDKGVRGETHSLGIIGEHRPFARELCLFGLCFSRGTTAPEEEKHQPIEDGARGNMGKTSDCHEYRGKRVEDGESGCR